MVEKQKEIEVKIVYKKFTVDGKIWDEMKKRKDYRGGNGAVIKKVKKILQRNTNNSIRRRAKKDRYEYNTEKIV